MEMADGDFSNVVTVTNRLSFLSVLFLCGVRHLLFHFFFTAWMIELSAAIESVWQIFSSGPRAILISGPSLALVTSSTTLTRVAADILVKPVALVSEITSFAPLIDMAASCRSAALR